MSTSPALRIENLSFSFPGNPVLRDINLSVAAGESVSLIGPSGFGKSTLLKLIAGDLRPDAGTITRRGLWRRVFQSNALLPWLTVKENILMGLRGIAGREVLELDKLVDVLGLRRVLHFYPRELSGGLAQRTELARALIGRPDGLLLDEPFSSLDYLSRQETKNYLFVLLRDFPITIVLVTHDIPEAISFTKSTFLMNGRPATIKGDYANAPRDQDLVERIWKDLKYHED